MDCTVIEQRLGVSLSASQRAIVALLDNGHTVNCVLYPRRYGKSFVTQVLAAALFQADHSVCILSPSKRSADQAMWGVLRLVWGETIEPVSISSDSGGAVVSYTSETKLLRDFDYILVQDLDHCDARAILKAYDRVATHPEPRGKMLCISSGIAAGLPDFGHVTEMWETNPTAHWLDAAKTVRTKEVLTQ